MLEKRLVEKCCREVLEGSVGEDCWREESCGKVSEKNVVEKCWRRTL